MLSLHHKLFIHWFNRIGTQSAIATLVFSAIASSSSAAHAFAVSLGYLTFSEVSGDFRIIAGDITGDGFYNIYQDVYGPNINLLMAIDGLSNFYKRTGNIGFRFHSVLTNRTNTPWILFDHELREKPTRRSPEEDGLSFAQGINFVRPFVSSRFVRVDEETDVRDYVNFSNGVVQPGETVIFELAITDRSPIDRFYLLQRPNFATGGSGFVPVAPVPSPQPLPSPVVTAPPQPTPPPVVTPTPSPSPSPLPEPSATSSPPTVEAVPEPATMLGAGLAVAGGVWLRRRLASRSH
jgi:hypothetical protein